MSSSIVYPFSLVSIFHPSHTPDTDESGFLMPVIVIVNSLSTGCSLMLLIVSEVKYGVVESTAGTNVSIAVTSSTDLN